MVVNIFFPSFVHILDIVAELRPDELPDRSAVTSFDQSQLKHVETQQKEVLPTKAGAVTPFTPFLSDEYAISLHCFYMFPMLLTRRICLTVKSFLSWQHLPYLLVYKSNSCVSLPHFRVQKSDFSSFLV